MIEKSRNFLFYSLIIISFVSFINAIIYYWIPISVPFSLYSIVSLTFTAYSLKIYYLIPIVFFICVLMFFCALSFRNQKNIFLAFIFMYLLCDLLFVSYSFFDTLFNDVHFIMIQAIQIIIDLIVITLICICFFGKKTEKTGDGSYVLSRK